MVYKEGVKGILIRTSVYNKLLEYKEEGEAWSDFIAKMLEDAIKYNNNEPENSPAEAGNAQEKSQNNSQLIRNNAPDDVRGQLEG